MKICVIGDYIHDEYIHGKCEKLSPEGPIPIFVKTHSEMKEGGAGNVVINLDSLGHETVLLRGRSNVRKIRYVCDNRILFRMDEEEIIQESKTDYLLEDCIKYVILSDYNKGMFHKCQEIVNNLKNQGKILFVDPKRPLSNYKGADYIKLNSKEITEYNEGMSHAELLRNHGFKALIITDSTGCVIVTRDYTTKIKTENVEISDVTGAGDIFIAVLTSFVAKGKNLEDACIAACKLASISVTKFGTYRLTDQDIKKVTPKTVFTNGVFDILHRGHVEYLKKSKELGDILIVGINSDESVKRNKGFCRPINNENDRKKLLESLSFVDQVIIFNESTPYELIRKLRPDIITKGADYSSVDVVGRDLAEVKIIPYVKDYSTTNIIGKIHEIEHQSNR